MKVIMKVFDAKRLGNSKMWEFLRSEGMDMEKPITCRASNSNKEYAVVYEGEKK